MKIIQELSEMISEEIEDADRYIVRALEVREKYPKVGELFYKLSGEEMQHMEALHGAVVTLIEEYRKEKGEPPANMMIVYDYLHKKQIEHSAKVKAMQALYK